MARLLAEDLLLLCWNDEGGGPHTRCSNTLTSGIGGALVIDALLAEALNVTDGRVEIIGTDPGDPLLTEVVTEAERGRSAPKVKQLVERVGTDRHYKAVRNRLVASGVLRAERRRLFGFIPVTRYPASDPSAGPHVRGLVRTLLTDERAPAEGEVRDVMLAGLAGSTGAVDLLVERSERKQARERAAALGEGHEVPEAVSEALKEATAAAMAAVTAAIAAGSTASSSSSN